MSGTGNKKKGGRPTKYNIKTTDEICAKIAEGESIHQISLAKGMPDEATIYRWLIKYEEFCDKYARAKEFQADRFNEEIVDIADDGRNDWEERENERTGKTFVALNAEAIARSRLRIETRKWLMSKHKPKKYGERLALSGDKEDPLYVKTEADIKLSPQDAYLEMLNGRRK